MASFHYWVRFEEGSGGNPHTQGLSYAGGNPSISGLRQSIPKEGSEGELAEVSVHVENEARADLARFFESSSLEWHPAKDEGGNQLYDFLIEHVMDDGELARAIGSNVVHGDARFDIVETDVVGHDRGWTKAHHACKSGAGKGKHLFARQRPGTTAPSQAVCRYLYPRS